MMYGLTQHHCPMPYRQCSPFDAELLPVALRAWVMDIAHLMQCPPDFPAVGAIAALSSLIGARHVIQPKARVDWQVVPNLWALIVGRPGVMKSPALGEVMRPLNRLEANERELWQAAHDSWELDCKVSAMQDDANEKKAKGHAAKGTRQQHGSCLNPVIPRQNPLRAVTSKTMPRSKNWVKSCKKTRGACWRTAMNSTAC
jgi:hypothetical protein